MFQCKDLLSLNSMSQANVLAGFGGMEKGIRWAYKAENINFEKWVHGEELLIISGSVTQRKNFNLFNIIKKAIQLNMSCALLLKGDNYVTQVDENVIKLAEENKFPLFTIPWNVPLLDFFEELGHAISYLDERKDIQDSLLAEIIFGNSVNVNNIERKCMQMGCEINVLEQIFIMHIKSISNDETCSFAESLMHYFEEKKYPSIVSCYGDRIVGFISDSSNDRDTIKEIFREFDVYLKKEKPDIIYSLYIGNKCNNLEDLQKSFQETSKINSILEHINRQNEVVFYDQMNFYRLLVAYENQEPMKHFVNEVLGEIIIYDKKNNTKLLNTLWEYYGCDCNLKRTADKLYLHKNTVKYRLQCIEKITGKYLDNRFQSLEMFDALIIYHFIN